MKSAAISCLLLTFCLSACATATPTPLSVESVIKHHEALDGKRVRLTGWVVKCWGYNCRITEFAGQQGRAILIGASRDFDEVTQRFEGFELRIELEATVSKDCFNHSSDLGADPDEIVMCTDRVSQLHKPVLIKVLEQRSLEPNKED